MLLLHIDVDDPEKALTQVTKLACLADFTLVCGWSYEECARYLETYKTYESKVRKHKAPQVVTSVDRFRSETLVIHRKVDKRGHMMGKSGQ